MQSRFGYAYPKRITNQVTSKTEVTLVHSNIDMKVKSLSRVRLFASPWTVAYQAPLSVGFSRQEYWGGLPFPSPPKQADLFQLKPQKASIPSRSFLLCAGLLLSPDPALTPSTWPPENTALSCYGL